MFPTQRSNLGLLHCQQILYHLSHHGSPLKKAVCVCVCVCYIPEMNTTLQINYSSIKYTYIYGSGGLVTKLCPTLCDPIFCSPPGSSVHGILQARILESVAMPFSRGSSTPRDQTHISCVPALAGRFFTTAPPGKCITIVPTLQMQKLRSRMLESLQGSTA